MVGIYKITSPSGKIYIGQSWNIENRWKSYYRINKGQRKLYYSIVKHGYDNHKFEICHELPEDISQEVLDNYEILYWELYKQSNKELLNIREPGRGGKLSNETKILLRNQNIKYIGVSQFDLKGVLLKTWLNSSEAALALGINISNICSNLQNRNKSAKGFIFKQGHYTENITPIKRKKVNKKSGYKQKRNVFQYDLNNNFIKNWNSIREAAKELNLSENAISNVCRGIQKQSGGFFWKKQLNN